MNGPAACCSGLRKAFGDDGAVDDVSLELHSGELLALLGPSGCGKTTLLRLLAGFEHLDAGTVTVAGRIVADAGRGTHEPPEKRRIGMVFQDYALFPHMTVEENIGYGVRRGQATARVAEMLELVGLGGLEQRRPHELSGGQQQRVALARALAPDPAVVLLDEPFSSLDSSLRQSLRAEVRQVLRDAGVAALLVTHDQEEALSLADRVAVMHDGRIEQETDPEGLYLRPANRWVAEFLGEVEVLPGRAAGGVADTELGTVSAPHELEGPVEVLLRPESVALSLEADDGAPSLVQGQGGTVVDRVYYGHDQLVCIRLDSGTTIRSRHVGFPTWDPGARVSVWLDGPSTVLPAAV